MPAVFVTGVSGFIGHSLCEKLMEKEIKVRGLVRKGSSRSIPENGAEIVETDSLETETDWKTKLRGIDFLVHLAGRAHFVQETEREAEGAYRKINVEGTVRLARGAAQAGVRRFVFVSSVKVNGEGREAPYTEDDIPAPEDAYGRSKREAEDLLLGISRETGMEAVIVRPPLVYGPGVRANFLRLMRLIGKGFPFPLASVKNLRSLVFLGNLTDALLLCLNHPGAPGKTFLLSDGHDISTPDLIKLIARSMGKPVRLFPFPPALLGVAARAAGRAEAAGKLLSSLRVENARIKKELGWKPPFTLEQGIDATVSWYETGKPDS